MTKVLARDGENKISARHSGRLRTGLKAPPLEHTLCSSMVDIHCHILPAVDDGSKSWEMTAEMCRVAIADGITHIVATPHCNPDFLYDRDHLAEMMGDLYDVACGQLTFSLGCDFHFSSDNIRDVLNDPHRYTIHESNYLLVEFADFGINPEVTRHLEELGILGIVPVITHPERNPMMLRHPQLVLDLAQQGCVVQVTANSFLGFWGSQSQKMAEWLLKRETIHVIATDAHDPSRRRPILSDARDRVAKLTTGEIAQALVKANPAAMVAGLPLPYRPALR